MRTGTGEAVDVEAQGEHVVLDVFAYEPGRVWLTVEESIELSRMIVKAAAEAAGIKEGVSS